MTKIILALLKEYNISSIRILNNQDRATRFYKLGYRKLVNKFIKINNANFSDFFGNQLEVISLLKKFMVSLTYIISGICAMTFLLIPIRRKFWGILIFFEGIGGLTGLFKVRYKEYN